MCEAYTGCFSEVAQLCCEQVHSITSRSATGLSFRWNIGQKAFPRIPRDLHGLKLKVVWYTSNFSSDQTEGGIIQSNQGQSDLR